jgi:hypothetical protein
MEKKTGDLQKNPASLGMRTKLTEMEAVAKKAAARQEQEEKQEKEKLRPLSRNNSKPRAR